MIEAKNIDRNKLTNYSTGLSEELSKGEVDPRDLLKEINSKRARREGGPRNYLDDVKRQLVFREFAKQALKEQKYKHPPGARGEEDEEWNKLKEGNTGIPIIDAAVKEMQKTGKPHNRARLLLARYAIRNLNVDPPLVAKWFAGEFKDYDPVITTFNVVSAASGANFGEPYFRKSNPRTADKKLDPTGEYKARWLPEGYNPRDPEEQEALINKGHSRWLKRWKENKGKGDGKWEEFEQHPLWPTKDPVKGLYFLDDKEELPARGSFSSFYRNYLNQEDKYL